MISFEFQSVRLKGITTAVPLNDNKHAHSEQTTSDLGFEAASQMLDKFKIDLSDVGILLFISKTADYRGPATSLVLQHRLNLSIDCIAFDITLGSCGFESALSTASALLNSNGTKLALCIFGDTSSKQLAKDDLYSNQIIDAASVVLLEKFTTETIFRVDNCTLSAAWKSYIIPSGGFRDGALFENLLNKRNHQTEESLHLDFSVIDSEIAPKIIEFITPRLNENSTMPIVLINSWSSKISNIIINICLKFGAQYYCVPSDTYAFSASLPLLMEEMHSNLKKSEYHVLTVSFGEGLSMAISEFSFEATSILPTLLTNNSYDQGFVGQEM